MAKSANMQIIDLADGRQVCLSYGTIVAAFLPATYDGPGADTARHALGKWRGFVRTSESFSVTSSKHANQFAGKDTPRIPHNELVALCAPIASAK
jgi:hypothetical protein